jgi:hypothetical protein
MNVEVYSIGSEVYFIDNNQKIACGYITEVDFNMKKAPNSDGYSSPFTQNTVYVIDDKFRRNAKYVFKSRKELIESL